MPLVAPRFISFSLFPMKAEVLEKAIVHLVDDDDSLRKALTRLLRAAGYEVQVYSSAAEILLARQGPLRGCLVLDVRMPGGPSGLELQRALARQGETIPVIFLTGHGDIPMCVQAIKDGAFHFLTKPAGREALLDAVQAALTHHETILRESAERQKLASRVAQLTNAELAVFSRITNGQPNKQIAFELGCCERTVKAHRAQVMRKMEVSSVADLARLAEQLDNQGEFLRFKSLSVRIS